MHEETTLASSHSAASHDSEADTTTAGAAADVPLFDPHGLSSSLSTSDDFSATSAIDLSALSEVAARRLGILPSSANSAADSSVTPPYKSTSETNARAFAEQGCTARGDARISAAPESPSLTRNWWERGTIPQAGKDGEHLASQTQEVGVGRDGCMDSPHGGQDRSPFAKPSSASSRPALSVKSSPYELEVPTDIDQPDVRSPAADFLSSFGSMNSVTNFAGPNSRSASPAGVSFEGFGMSAPTQRLRVFSDNTQVSGWDSRRGIMASNLFDRPVDLPSGTSQLPHLRPDEEGSRIGPQGRYLLGKTIGFGGFSTVREGWDTGGHSVDADPQQEPHRVAVKLIYSEPTADGSPASSPLEVSLWRSLHAHPHLLPLLHYERISLSRFNSGRGQSQSSSADALDAYVDALVMPFCDHGSLLDFVRKEGGRRGSDATASRRPSLESLKSPARTTETDSAVSMDRTGSGFLHRAVTLGPAERASRAITHRYPFRPMHPPSSLSTAGVQAPETTTLSRASSVSGGSLFGARRASSSRSAAKVRSEGISVSAAQDVLHQLASAVSTLHGQARVLHGDLKLDNVLGQTTTPTALTPGGVCWRVADFGLARKVDDTEGAANTELLRHLKKSADSLDSSASHTLPRSAGRQVKSTRAGETPSSYLAGARQILGVGGSLAYTPPEVLKSPLIPGSTNERLVSFSTPVSPFARDMWALGCILYALLSGRLPFADTFEPRLQLKITRAQWEFPARLQRRAERLLQQVAGGVGSRRPSVTSPTSASLQDRSGSFELNAQSAHLARQNVAIARAPSLTGPRSRSTVSTAIDMSASLPSLRQHELAHGRHVSAASARGLPSHTPSHWNHVVGSAPSGPDDVTDTASTHSHAIIDSEALSIAAATPDPESDDDEVIDTAWDGNSETRAAAREALCGLLDPDPARRWTVDRLTSCHWLTTLRPVHEVPFSSEVRFSSSTAATSSDLSEDDTLPTAQTHASEEAPVSISQEAGSVTKRATPLPVPMPSPTTGREGSNYFSSTTERERRSRGNIWHTADDSPIRGRWDNVAADHEQMRERSSSRGRLHRSRSRGGTERQVLPTTEQGDPGDISHYSEMALAAAQSSMLSRRRSDLGGGIEHGWGGRAATPSSEEEGDESPADPPRGRRRMVALDEEDAVRNWESKGPRVSGSGLHIPARPIAIRTASSSPMRARRSMSSRGRMEARSPDGGQRGRSSSARPSPITGDRSSPAPSLRVLQASSSFSDGLDSSRTAATVPSSTMSADSAAALSMFNARRDRSSTSRSRSRAPDALAHILNQDRERSSSGGRRSSSRGRTSEGEGPQQRNGTGGRAEEEGDGDGGRDGQWWERGRARLPKSTPSS